MKYFNKLISLAILFLVIILPFIFFISVYMDSYEILINLDESKPNLSTKIYDVNDELISELFDENRSFIAIDNIPDIVKKTFIITEDRNFYKHTGIDLIGILRAILIDILSGNIKQGGSTITQQLAKQLYTGGEKTLRRKVLELLIAREFEKNYSKDKILEMYLNQIYFGHGVYGIKSAAKFYFNLEVEKLNIIEASILAAIPSAPGRFSPLKKPLMSFERNKQVIHNIIQSGIVSKSEAAEKFNSFWSGYLDRIKTIDPLINVRNKKFDKAPYFTEYIRRILVKKYGEDLIYRGGVQVYTTLDLRFQEIARNELNKILKIENKIASRYNKKKLKHIDRMIAKKALLGKRKGKWELKKYTDFLHGFRNNLANESLLGFILLDIRNAESLFENFITKFEELSSSSRVEGALVALNPKSGGILTMIGGSNFNRNNQLNRAVQSRRQPGSAFKTFVYGAGIDSGRISPASPFIDAPIIFKGTRKSWSPSNYEKSFEGRVLTRKAFAASLNIVSVLIYEKLGGQRIARFASKLTNTHLGRFEIDPTLALGTSELTPLEMTTGFAVYANNGIEVIPYSIRYILDNNDKKIYYKKKAAKRRLISPQSAFIMTSMLRNVVDSGTASSAIRHRAGFRLPAAGKTGTNTDFRDAWFVGFTPDIAAAVWIGCDSQKFTLARWHSGAHVAAPVWGSFMKGVYKHIKPSMFMGKPAGVRVISICRKTGMLPLKNCPIKREYFISGTVPETKCNGDHEELVSIFELVKKKKEELREKEKKKKAERDTPGE